ncbi:MAG: 50S ribosomal protein L20 [Candidatus Magasanikbacteria bacterium GW2011_GWA2_50_22]|uniref:Large ribosomal subunit protein bL20 n=1 Tax=Candidatus Magasanikbacteria bacterium GW2011_GWA2_50_22 TaxID=1619043 RepID=A0A0G1WF17_9BACT|nr:MAG: 50S ribosomal protein L20 [Candidatus Magasanikbacteria bacterium GW2011_GWA2_50_22]
MPRVKRGTHRVKRRKKYLQATKGYKWGRKSKITLMKPAMLKAGAHAYADRRRKKREFRALWNIRINAAARDEGMKYSTLISALHKKGIALDRKALSTLAIEYPQVFAKVVSSVK